MLKVLGRPNRYRNIVSRNRHAVKKQSARTSGHMRITRSIGAGKRKRIAPGVIVLVCLAGGFIALPAAAEVAVGDVSAQSREICSPVVVGVGGNVTVNSNCSIGLSQQDLERIREAVRGGLAVVFAEQISD